MPEPGDDGRDDGPVSVPPLPQPPALPEQWLCASTEIAERGRAWVWDVLEYGRPVRAFVLRVEGRLSGFVNRCLHVPVEMDWNPGEFLDSERRFILCTVHGAAYEPSDGRCVGGPCGRGRLTPVAVAERDGQVYWYPSRDIRPVPFDAVDDGAAAAAPPA